MNFRFFKQTCFVILVVFAVSSFGFDMAIAEKQKGFILKKSISKPTFSHSYPVTIELDNDFIYSQPNTSEAFRIGYGAYPDKAEALEEIEANNEKWVAVSFNEILLLKNKEYKAKLVSSLNKQIIEFTGSLVGALIVSSIYAGSNSNESSGLSAIGPLAAGAAIGFLVSSFCVNRYNDRITKSLNK